MAKRIFTSFAMEDKTLRDFLVGQRLHSRTPFEFVDMSVKDPWSSDWKTRCRSRIASCDGVIGLITQNTPRALGQLWELRCAYEEGVPVLLLHGYREERLSAAPIEIKGRRVNDWSWDNIASFIDGV